MKSALVLGVVLAAVAFGLWAWSPGNPSLGRPLADREMTDTYGKSCVCSGVFDKACTAEVPAGQGCMYSLSEDFPCQSFFYEANGNSYTACTGTGKVCTPDGTKVLCGSVFDVAAGAYKLGHVWVCLAGDCYTEEGGRTSIFVASATKAPTK